MDDFLVFDQTLFLYLNGLGQPKFDWFWLLLTHKATNAVVYISMALWCGYHYGWPVFFRIVLISILLVGCTDQITNLFKYGFERLRPCHESDLAGLMRLAKSNCGGLYSFFSGHASNSFALATFFFGIVKRMLPRLRWLLFLLAALIAYSRVYLGVHYPLDIFCGTVFGLLIGKLFYRLSCYFQLLSSN